MYYYLASLCIAIGFKSLSESKATLTWKSVQAVRSVQDYPFPMKNSGVI